MSEQSEQQISVRVIEDEMKQAYMAYAMSVIVGRALPDARDGLKPVHRRILFAMHQNGMQANQPHKKSARIVGETLGKYHPHGDSAVYDSLVRMAQDFSLRYPLIDGQGNFGCFTGDTKVRLADGRNLSFEELVKEYKQGKKNSTFTVDKKGSIEIAEIKHPRLTKTDASLVKVLLNNGQEITCTPDHRFMLQTQEYREAQNLKPEDSLASFDRSSSAEIQQTNFLEENKVARVDSLTEKKDVYDLTIDHTHNFSLAAGVFVHNSIDADPAAAQRYTEARLAKISSELLADIEKETVDWMDNFDGSEREPTVLPTVLPNLLLNGSAGIAVGMATNIPPHNLKELSETILQFIENPDLTPAELMQYLPGPDFPTGGVICGSSGILSGYKFGRGKIRVRAVVEREEYSKGTRLIVTEMPYQVVKANTIEHIANLVRDKRIEGISDIRDESDRRGIRVVIELKRDANPDVVETSLFKYTRLQVTFGVNTVALVNGQPRLLSLPKLLTIFLDHRKDVIRKRTKFDLRKAKERAHILEGLLIALNNIDAIVNLIKKSSSSKDAQEQLIALYELSEVQAKAILDMRLHRLTGLEQDKIRSEHKDLLEKIADLEDILARPERVVGIIKEELNRIKEKYGDERRTRIIEAVDEIDIEDLIEPEEMVVTITHQGYVKRISADTYQAQRRGGVGIIGAKTKDDDVVEQVFVANTHSYVLFFTDKGRVHWKKVYQLPESGRAARGSNIVNLLQLGKDEKVSAAIPVKKFDDERFLVFATKKGVVKKTVLSAYSRPRQGGINAIGLQDDDDLVTVVLTDGDQALLLASQNGQAVRFSEKDIRPMGRTAFGVRGMSLQSGDSVVSLSIAPLGSTVLTVTEKGFGKRSPIEDYRLIRRGGLGVRNIQTTARNGRVVAVRLVAEDDELLIMSKNGVTIRTKAKDISVIGRNTQGVRIMRLREGDSVGAVAKIASEETPQEE